MRPPLWCIRENCGHAEAIHDANGCKWPGCKCSRLIVSLTEREKQVLKMLCEGHTEKEIATVLLLSPKTVKAHRESTARKLNTHGFAEMLGVALRAALVKLEDLPFPTRDVRRKA